MTDPKPTDKSKKNESTQATSTPDPSSSTQQKLADAKFFTNFGLPMRHYYAKMPKEGTPWYSEGEKLTAKVGHGFLYALVGNRGTGKTLMAVKMMLHAAKSGISVKYQTAMNIFLNLKDGYAHNQSALEIVQIYTQPLLLVIDAMEVRGETKFEDQILDHIIDTRYSGLKDTLLISNQNVEEFSESAGPSIISRLKETGGIIECYWASFR